MYDDIIWIYSFSATYLLPNTFKPLPFILLYKSPRPLVYIYFDYRVRVTKYNPYKHSTCTKLRTDNFKGGVSTLATLPLNKLMVLGSDTGNISMFS